MATPKSTRVPLPWRFMRHVEMITETGCWIWMGHLNGGGYGTFRFGRTNLAHRAAYEIFRGPIPAGLEPDHLCRVRCCVNPRHLELVTHLVNIRRGIGGRTSAARERAKTHCPRGHKYNAENTFVTQGGRKCRACRKLFDRARYFLHGRRDRRHGLSAVESVPLKSS